MNDDKQRFLQDLKSALQQQTPGRTFDVDEAGETVRFGDGASINLGNIFRTWQQADEPRRAFIISNVVASTRPSHTAAPVSLAAANQQLLWRIRDTGSRQLFAMHMEAEGSEPRSTVERPLGDHLRATVVIDTEETMQDVTPELLEKWRCDAEAVFAAAQRNLELLPSPFTSPWPGVYLVENDNYAASALLRADAKTLLVQGRPLAFATHRSLLLITGDADEDGLLKVVERLEAEFDQPYPISVRPLVFDGASWVTHRPAANTPAGARLENLRIRELAGLYEEEGKLLQARLGDQVFVATYVTGEEAGVLHSRAVWSEGVRTLLPETETLVFAVTPEIDDRSMWSRLWAPKKKWVATAPFERVLKVVGHRMERQGGEITRYLVNSFPTNEEFAAIGVTELHPQPQP